MNVVSVIIIGIIMLGATLGASRGFTKQLLSFFGWIVIITVSFLLKDIVSKFLLSVCPFFKFSGLTSLNILLYEGISFLILVALLSTVLGIFMRISTLFEKLLKMTIILGIPSKILGALVGAFEYFCISFVVLYILSSPLFSIKAIEKSSLAHTILNSTPILSNFSNKTVNVFTEIKELINDYEHKENKTKINNEIIDIMIENKIVSSSKVNELIDSGKLQKVEKKV